MNTTCTIENYSLLGTVRYSKFSEPVESSDAYDAFQSRAFLQYHRVFEESHLFVGYYEGEIPTHPRFHRFIHLREDVYGTWLDLHCRIDCMPASDLIDQVNQSETNNDSIVALSEAFYQGNFSLGNWGYERLLAFCGIENTVDLADFVIAHLEDHHREALATMIFATGDTAIRNRHTVAFLDPHLCNLYGSYAGSRLAYHMQEILVGRIRRMNRDRMLARRYGHDREWNRLPGLDHALPEDRIPLGM